MRSISAKGFLLMFASGISSGAMSILIKVASNIDSYKTALFRFVIGLCILATAAIFRKIRLDFTNSRALFLRGLFGGFAIFFFYLAISRLGIGRGSVLSYSYPIFAAIFGAIILKERIGSLKIMAILAAFTGIFLLSAKGNKTLLDFFQMGKYESLAIAGSVCAGMAVVLVKKLHETDSTYAIFFAQCAIGIWLVVIPANLTPCSIGYSGGAMLLSIGVFASISQLLMTEGYRYVSVTQGSLWGLLTPIFNFFVGVSVFHEYISWTNMVGAILVLISCAVIIWAEERIA